MSNNRATFLVGIGGCLFGAMLPILLGASQAPEKQFPRYSLSGSGEHYLIVVDNQKDELHLYSSIKNGGDIELYKTVDLSQVGEKKLSHKYYQHTEMLKKMDEQRNRTQLPPKTPK